MIHLDNHAHLDDGDTARKPSASIWAVPLIAAIACLIVAAALLAVADGRGLDVSSLLRDPAVEFDIPVYAGGISFLGISLLLLSSGCTALAASVLPNDRGLLLALSAFSLLLAYDDQFMLHERVFNRMGIPEIVVLATYAIAGCALLAALWFSDRRVWTIGFLVAVGFMGISVLADLVETSYVIEDLLKVASFAAWLGFCLSFSRQSLIDATHSPDAAGPARP
ncbi:hypothetical protein [Tropicimonas marinistellae]|uniref:hypothetical protein n=1 Tax=Tropicimonas marinistellae TaxID=1739787 RepID=UPI00082A5FCE|nr:hypothetical protein [Tropicimonas marinistellae]